MKGYRFSRFVPPSDGGAAGFDKLLKIFLELLTITSGDAAEALNWLTQVD